MNTHPPSVTICIPTYRRPEYLRISLGSALAQDHPDFQVVVLDNSETNEIEQAVSSFGDPRVIYLHNPVNLGMLGNFNRALEFNRSPFFAMLLDDDRLEPSFLRETMSVMDAHPNVGIVFTTGRYMDAFGKPLDPDRVDLPHGVTRGLDYIEMNIGRRRGGSMSTALMRSSVLEQVGGYDSPHSRHTTDFNLYLRLARISDVAFVPKQLAWIRRHVDQESETDWGPERLGMDGEYLEGITMLLESERAASANYRAFLARRLRETLVHQSELLHLRKPSLQLPWKERLAWLCREVDRNIPAGNTFILANDQQWDLAGTHTKHKPRSFLERNGCYWGPPADDETAIRELAQMRDDGASHFVIAWPSFWWLEHFSRFREHLYEAHQCLLTSPRVRIFRLAPAGERQP